MDNQYDLPRRPDVYQPPHLRNPPPLPRHPPRNRPRNVRGPRPIPNGEPRVIVRDDRVEPPRIRNAPRPPPENQRTDETIGTEDGFGTHFALNCSNNLNTWTGSLAGFSDLVQTTYLAMTRRDRKIMAVLPPALFRYYCYTALWRRIISIDRTRMTIELERDADTLNRMGGMTIPHPIAQFLASIGDIHDADGTISRFILDPSLLEFRQDAVAGLFGYYPDSHRDVAIISLYGVIPNPGVYCHAIQCEIESNTNAGPFLPNWRLPEGPMPTPAVVGTDVHATRGCQGWFPSTQWPARSRNPYTDLGWTANTSPPDAQRSILNVSVGTLDYVQTQLRGTTSIRMTTLTSHQFEVRKATNYALGRATFHAAPVGPNDPAALRDAYTLNDVDISSTTKLTNGSATGALMTVLRYDWPAPSAEQLFRGMPFYDMVRAGGCSGIPGLHDAMTALSRIDRFERRNQVTSYSSPAVPRDDEIWAMIQALTTR